MRRRTCIALTATALLSLIASCRAPDTRARTAPVSALEPRIEGRSKHQASPRQVALLEELIVLDRQALEIAEQQLASWRQQWQAGGRATVELVPAERAVIRCKQTLLLRECELADAQLGVSGDRRVAVLEKLVDLDQRMVDLAQQEQSQMEQFFNAGRREMSDLVAAKSTVLRCRQALLHRKLALAEAQVEATSSGASDQDHTL